MPGRWAVCTAPTQQARAGGGRGGEGARKDQDRVQRGRCIPAGFTFGVNKVRTHARGDGKCYAESFSTAEDEESQLKAS